MSEETKAFDEMQNSTSQNPEPPVTENDVNAQSAEGNDRKVPENPEEAKKEELYSRGMQLMQDQKFDQAIKCFDKIPQYKDSKQKSDEAKKLKEEARRVTSYDNAMKAFNTGHYDTAIVLFTSLKDYKDAKAKLAICNEKREIARKDAIYDDVMKRAAIEGISIADLDKCINELKTISGHKDVDSQIKKLTERLEGQKAAEARARAKAKKRAKIIGIISASVAALVILATVFLVFILPPIRYSKAEKLLNEGRYDEALKIYESLNGRDESEERVAVINAIADLEDNLAESVRKITSAGVSVNVTYNLDEGAYQLTYYSYDYFGGLYTPTKDGYSFRGWELDTYSYTAGGMFELSLNPTWNARSYQVTLNNTRETYIPGQYEYSYGSTAYITVNFGSSYTLPTLTQERYVFDGWYNGNDKVDSATWNIASNVTLTPKWSGKAFTVTLDPDGGSVSSTSVKVAYDAGYTLPTPTWAGHIFCGWYYNGSTVATSGTWRLASDVTLVALWDVETYSISYDLNGGTGDGSNPVRYSVYDSFTLADPTKTGYRFTGWTYEGQTTPVMQVTVEVGTTGNKAYTANWEANTYTVTLDLDGGTIAGGVITLTVTYDEAYTLPTEATKTGYTFYRWNRGSSLFPMSGTWTYTENITLTAQWTARTDTPYTVKHYKQNADGDGYTLAETENFVGTTASSVSPAVKTYEHYDSPSVQTVTIAADGSTVVEYRYDVATYYVICVTGGGDAMENQPFKYGQIPSAPAAPTRSGYTFGGWFSDPELTTAFELTSAPEGNVTAYAWWQEEIKPGDFTYSGTDEITIIAYNGADTVTVVNIPSYIGTVPVTEIADSAFAGKTNITKITIPNTVTEMGEGVFAGCTSLTELVMPSVSNVVSSGSLYTTQNNSSYRWTVSSDGTVYSTNKSHSSSSSYIITASTNITLVLQYKVSSEANFDKLSIKKNSSDVITPISGSTSYTTVTIVLAAGDRVTCTYSKDGSSSSGSDCAYIKIVSVTPQSYGLGSLFGTESVDGTTAITQNYTTYYVPSTLSKVTITSESVGDYAFDGFTMLEEVQLVNVEAIGRYAFSNCSSLKRLNSTTDGVFNIPDSVTEIGQNAFYGCSAVETMTVPFIGNNADSTYGFSYIFGTVPSSLNSIIISTDTTIPDSAFYNLPYVESITIPSGVTSIPDNAFMDCISLTVIELPTSVISIGNSAFSGCISLEEIELPASVTSIGTYAFNGCTSLTAIELSESLESIGDYAFYGCALLEEIELPESLESIGSYAFYGCTSIKRINSDTDGELILPEGLETIGSYAFQNLTQITKIIVPDSVTSIGQYAFYGCTAVETITVPFVGYSADSTSGFYYIFNSVPRSLKSITISTDTTIPNQAFYGLQYVESITLSSDVTSIGSSAFYNCISLTEIELPESLESIGDHAFYGCISLTEIEFPESLTSIGSNVFSGCTSLKRVNSETDGELILPEGFETIGSYAFQGLTQITNVVIPDSVTGIGAYAFSGCTSIKRINSDTDGELILPEGLETIGSYAFQNLTRITKIIVPDSVTSIGSYAFYGCSAVETITVPFVGNSASSTSGFYCIFNSVPSSLKNIVITTDTTIPDLAFNNLYYVENINIPSDVTSIGNSSFYGCTSLARINSTTDGVFNIPDSVTSIGSYAFYGCSAVETITVPFVGSSATSTSDFYYIFNSVPSSLKNIVITTDTTIPDSAFSSLSYVESITIPSGVTSIGSNAFYGCTSLKRLNSSTDGLFNIPEGITTIQPYTFYNCGAMTKVTVPAGVTSIGDNAFNSCSNLEEVEFATGCELETIGNYAFAYCTSLSEIQIPESVTTIGSYAFGGCTALERLNSDTDGELIVPESITVINSSTFRDLTQITKVVIPEGVTSIGNSAFYGCTSLAEIELPESLESIGNYAFYGCTALARINSDTDGEMILPEGLQMIGSYAFQNLVQITEIIVPDSVTSIGQYAFSGCSALEAITVPFVGNSASSTNNFSYIFGTVPNSLKIITITTDKTIPDSAFYNLQYVESITIPSDVTGIGNYAFYRCTSLARINSDTDGEMILPEGLQTIGSYAFQSLTQITTVVVPDSVTSIGEGAFYGCSGLEDITLPFVGSGMSSNGSNSAVFGYIFGRYTSSWSSTTSKPSNTTYQGWGMYSSSYNTTGAYGRNYYYNTRYYADYYYIPTSIKSVTITVDTTIPYGAFHNCGFIETIILPKNVISEGEYAYQNCTETVVSKTYNPTLVYWDGNMSESLLGSGTEDEPYQINSAEDLAYLASSVNSGTSYEGEYFILNVNINLNGRAWTPIGTDSKPFAGTFNGNGKKIGNFSVSLTTAYAGLFGNVSGTVKNLGITSGTVSPYSSSSYTNNYVGGLVGYLTGSVENCYSCATVTASTTYTVHAGGLVGYVDTGATVINSYATGSVTAYASNGFSYAGGMAGLNKGTISGSLAFGNVSANGQGDAYCRNGGFVGRNNGGTLTDCYRSEDQVLVKYNVTGAAYNDEGNVASYSDMIEYAQDNWDSSVWEYDLKYPNHK